jgi:hypothetical protein
MLYLFVGLKIPILLAGWIVWWAVKQVPDPSEDAGDDRRPWRRPHPPPKLPRAPRRGPHGGHAQSPPPRVRHVTARGRELAATARH